MNSKSPTDSKVESSSTTNGYFKNKALKTFVQARYDSTTELLQTPLKTHSQT